MDKIIADNLSVCSDCVHIIANGEITDGREDEGQSVAEAQVSLWGDDAIGLALTGEDAGFSWSACDGCGSTLAGDRHEAVCFAR